MASLSIPTGVCYFDAAESPIGTVTYRPDQGDNPFQLHDMLAERLAFVVASELQWFSTLASGAWKRPRDSRAPLRFARGTAHSRELREALDNWNTLRRFALGVSYSPGVETQAFHGIAEADVRRYAKRLAMRWDCHVRGVRGVSMACPSYFRACCREASWGGQRSYADAGWHLAIHLRGFDADIDDDADAAEWGDLVDAMIAKVRAGDDVGVWEWFADHLPRCAALVPERRREKFIEGVRHADDEGRV